MALFSLGLGSNLGDRYATLHTTIHDLTSLGAITAVSPFYETAAVGWPGAPDFINAVVQLESSAEPQDLMNGLLDLEQRAGRRRTQPNAPRILDIDILDCDGKVITSPCLTLPHPRMWSRLFVLVPLADLQPQWRHPLFPQSLASRIQALLDETTLGLHPRMLSKVDAPAAHDLQSAHLQN